MRGQGESTFVVIAAAADRRSACESQTELVLGPNWGEIRPEGLGRWFN